jgi:hypothetical protein
MTQQEMADRYALNVARFDIIFKKAMLESDIDMGLISEEDAKTRAELISRLECGIATREARVETFNRHCKLMRFVAKKEIDKNTEDNMKGNIAFSELVSHVAGKNLETDIKESDLKYAEEIISMSDEEILLYEEAKARKTYPTEEQAREYLEQTDEDPIAKAVISCARNISVLKLNLSKLSENDQVRAKELNSIIDKTPAQFIEYVLEERAKKLDDPQNN